MIGRNGERRSGISAQAARHDDDDEDIRSGRKIKEIDNRNKEKRRMKIQIAQSAGAVEYTDCFSAEG